ncbi:MAG: 2-C-methyl-D-erythritol 4-phosphate cytidylyltransferase [Thermoanaerobaculaceae bacterium]
MNASKPEVVSPDLGIVVVAAGASRRFGCEKLSLVVAGKTVLEHAVTCLRQAYPQAPLVVVVRREQLPSWQSRFPYAQVVAGGDFRQDSVRRGVEALKLPPQGLVVIHDGARPFVPVRDVQAVVAAAQEVGAAILVAPVADTLKEVDTQGQVVATVPRERLVRSLTPQAFRRSLLEEAWQGAEGRTWTDEAALLEALGHPVKTVPGDAGNLKVTYPEDVRLLRGLFPPSFRVGQGIDVHPFAPGRKLILAGVEIPWELGLAGHSDADVVLHAVTDALLGACGAGDIGEHFPPTDPRWAGVSSDVFVRFALKQAAQAGWELTHCDVTVLLEKPRLSPYRQAMVENLAALLGLTPSVVNVKATTTEGMGFVGRREGVVALAVVSLVGS